MSALADICAATPWLPTRRVPAGEYQVIRRRAIFELCKWDPQVEDVATLADFPLVLAAAEWTRVAALAESLCREAMAAERELLARTELHELLGLPARVVRALGEAAGGRGPRELARLMRFDFHYTTEGWRISEVNSDVPGGLNEASGLPALFAAGGAATTGDPAGMYAAALAAGVPPGGTIALAHATAYTDDRQVMTYVARELEVRGVHTVLVGPDGLRWHEGRASLATPAHALDAVVRFFPAEWLVNLGPECGWRHWFAGSATPLSNPATAVLVQSKRFPLLWDHLHTPLPAWRTLLPATCDPRDAPAGWVLKPCLGRVGEGVGIPGVTAPEELRVIEAHARRRPREWIAQRPFAIVPLEIAGARAYPCVGVYTVDGIVAGAYGRVSVRPLIDHRAQDAPVLVSPHAA